MNTGAPGPLRRWWLARQSRRIFADIPESRLFALHGWSQPKTLRASLARMEAEHLPVGIMITFQIEERPGEGWRRMVRRQRAASASLLTVALIVGFSIAAAPLPHPRPPWHKQTERDKLTGKIRRVVLWNQDRSGDQLTIRCDPNADPDLDPDTTVALRVARLPEDCLDACCAATEMSFRKGRVTQAQWGVSRENAHWFLWEGTLGADGEIERGWATRFLARLLSGDGEFKIEYTDYRGKQVLREFRVQGLRSELLRVPECGWRGLALSVAHRVTGAAKTPRHRPRE